jgi:hypothetical protein
LLTLAALVFLMAIRALTILTLLILALLFIGSAYSEVQSRPYGQLPAPVQDDAHAPPYLSALPLAAPLPAPTKKQQSEIGVGTKRFVRPGVEGVRLDWCVGPGQNRGCGPPAAQLFCQNQGYSRAVSMVEEQGVGLAEPTKQIGSHQTCKGPNCSGFLSLTCTKS